MGSNLLLVGWWYERQGGFGRSERDKLTSARTAAGVKVKLGLASVLLSSRVPRGSDIRWGTAHEGKGKVTCSQQEAHYGLR